MSILTKNQQISYQFVLTLILLLIFSGCTQTKADIPSATSTPNPTITQFSFPTTTSTQIEMTSPEVTQTPDPPKSFLSSRTANFDPGYNFATTRSPAVQCPEVNSAYQPLLPEYVSVGSDLAQPILVALNQGASFKNLEAGLKKVGAPLTDANGNQIMYGNKLTSLDLTNDGVPEIQFYSEDGLAIFTCQQGQYILGVFQPGEFLKVSVNDLHIEDINQDGILEIIYRVLDTNAVDGVYLLFIYAWNGNSFRNLIVLNAEDIDDDPSDPRYSGAFIHEAGSSLTFPIKYSNGIHDVEIRGVNHCFSCQTSGPWRWFTYTLTWNGSGYQSLPVRLDPPTYRFQAIQDGDRESLRGNYEEALAFYHQALEDKNLKGWSEKLFSQQEDVIVAYAQEKPTPTPLPPDPNEYAVLSAYARYRIMLIEGAENHTNQLRSDFQSFKQQVQPSQPGYDYLKLATIFWNAYHVTDDVVDACVKTRQYAYDNYEAIFYPINSLWHGWQSPDYDHNQKLICPFE